MPLRRADRVVDQSDAEEFSVFLYAWVWEHIDLYLGDHVGVRCQINNRGSFDGTDMG